MNRKLLLSEATALPTEPQPLPILSFSFPTSFSQMDPPMHSVTAKKGGGQKFVHRDKLKRVGEEIVSLHFIVARRPSFLRSFAEHFNLLRPQFFELGRASNCGKERYLNGCCCCSCHINNNNRCFHFSTRHISEHKKWFNNFRFSFSLQMLQGRLFSGSVRSLQF